MAEFLLTAIGIGAGVIFALIIIAPLTLILIGIEGFVLQKLWMWFIIPTFQAPNISLAAAIGIILTFRLIKGTSSAYKKPAADFTPNEQKQAIADAITQFIGPFLVLFIAWLVKSMCMGG